MIKIENEVTVNDLAEKYLGQIGDSTDLQLATQLLIEEFGLDEVVKAISSIRSVRFQLETFELN